jgi:hypothetical protein
MRRTTLSPGYASSTLNDQQLCIAIRSHVPRPIIIGIEALGTVWGDSGGICMCFRVSAKTMRATVALEVSCYPMNMV